MVFFNNTKKNSSYPTHVKQWVKRFFTQLKEQCLENFILIALCVVSFLALQFTLVMLGEGGQQSFMAYLRRAIFSISPSILFCYVVCRLFRLAFIEKPDFILLTLGRDIKDVLLNPRRYARMIPMLLMASLGFISFITFKAFIPDIIPFYGDKTFMEMDKFLHFGKLPTDWLVPLLSMPSMIQGLDFFYKLWYFVMFGLWGWASWGATDRGWRRQFVLSFMLCWIVGGAVLATLFSSVGPCFYGLFVEGVNPYAQYMSGLESIHANNEIMALNIQSLLAGVHFDPNNSMKIGISAMPSLHNTLAVLFAIAGYKIHKNLGHILAAYAVIIFIGSVALGWHYAVDGYAGLIIAIAMWKLAGWCLAQQDRILRLKTSEAPA